MNSSSLQRYLHVRSVIIKFIFAALTQIVDPSFQLFYRKNRPHEQGVQPVGATGGEGGGYSTMSYTGRLRPEIQPCTPLYAIFDRKGTPFVYPLSTN